MLPTGAPARNKNGHLCKYTVVEVGELFASLLYRYSRRHVLENNGKYALVAAWPAHVAQALRFFGPVGPALSVLPQPCQPNLNIYDTSCL